MSVKIMGLVWDLRMEPNRKFVLLAYADHANHEGKNVFPAVETISKKTGYHERSVQRLTRALEDSGYLVADGLGPNGTNKWRIPLTGGGDKIAPLTNCRGDTDSGDIPSGDKMPPESFNRHLDDDIEQRTAKLATLYQDNIGVITPLMADILRNAAIDFPVVSWYEPAFAIAVGNNARSWNYVDAILQGWKQNGFGWKPNGTGKNHGNGKSAKDSPPVIPIVKAPQNETPVISAEKLRAARRNMPKEEQTA